MRFTFHIIPNSRVAVAIMTAYSLMLYSFIDYYAGQTCTVGAPSQLFRALYARACYVHVLRTYFSCITCQDSPGAALGLIYVGCARTGLVPLVRDLRWRRCRGGRIFTLLVSSSPPICPSPYRCGSLPTSSNSSNSGKLHAVPGGRDLLYL